jgi:hypothetical protein
MGQGRGTALPGRVSSRALKNAVMRDPLLRPRPEVLPQKPVCWSRADPTISLHARHMLSRDGILLRSEHPA